MKKFIQTLLVLLVLAFPVRAFCAVSEKDCGVSDESGLIMFYRFNEGEGAAAGDAAGSNTGAISGAAWAEGRFSQGLHFDGVDDYIDCGSGASLNFEYNTPVTFMFWIKMDDLNAGASRDIISKIDMMGGNVQRGFRIFQYPGTVINFQMAYERAPGLNYFNVYTGVGAGWHHVAVTYSGGSSANNVNFYLDGTPASKSIELNALSGTIQNNKSMVIGRIGDGGSWFPGSLDEIRIYDRVLGASEIKELAAAFTSGVFDGGAKKTYRTRWAPSNLAFYARSASDTRTGSSAWIACSYDSLVKLERYFQYKISSSSTVQSIEISPFFIKGIVPSPSTLVKGGTLTFNVYFTEDMLISETPTVSFTLGQSTYTSTRGIPGGGWRKGSWASVDLYSVAYPDIHALAKSGYASITVSGVVTLAGDTMVDFTEPYVLLIDCDDIAGPGIEFFPNPFSPNKDGRNEETRLINLPVFSEPSRVSVKICNIKGALVRTLFDGEAGQGAVSITPWDGKDNSGFPCPVGIYIFQVRVGDGPVRTGTVVLAK